jgi:hypothetical protein
VGLEFAGRVARDGMSALFRLCLPCYVLEWNGGQKVGVSSGLVLDEENSAVLPTLLAMPSEILTIPVSAGVQVVHTVAVRGLKTMDSSP